MRCEQALDQLSDYCEGALSGPLLVALEHHLQGCEACRSAASDLGGLYKELSTGAAVVDPPADFRAQVWRKIGELETGRANRLPRWLPDWRVLLTRRGLAWGAAAALIVALWGSSVPGRRVAAWLGLPVAVRSPASELPVLIGEGTVVDGRLRFTMTTTRGVPMRVSVSVAGRSDEAVALTMEPGQAVEVALPAPAETGRVLVRIAWQASGEVRSETVPVRVR